MTKRDDTQKKRIISIAIVALFVLSSFGIMFSGYANQKSTLEYKGLTFEQKNDYLTTTVNKTKIKIQTNPYQVEQIPIDNATGNILAGKHMIYVAFPVRGLSPEYASLAVYDLSEFLASRGVSAIQGISDDNSGYNHIQMIDCRNATANVAVVLFEISNETIGRVVADGNCIRLQTTAPTQFIALKDRIVLRMMGVA